MFSLKYSGIQTHKLLDLNTLTMINSETEQGLSQLLDRTVEIILSLFYKTSHY